MDAAFFAYSWKLPAYSGALLLTVDNFSLFAYSWSLFAYNFISFTYSWSSFAYSGQVRLIRALRDCKRRSLTVSKKAPTVSKKVSPVHNSSARNSGAGIFKWLCRSYGQLAFFGSFCWETPRTRRIGANPEKSDLVNFGGPD